jgi:DNA-binding beta-propeller fold protein YncE
LLSRVGIRTRLALSVALLCLLGVLSGGVASADAAAPSLLLRIPELGAPPSEGLDQLGAPVGIATDPVSGHFYVSDSGNKRIDEFTEWGQFVKTWGWGVVRSGPDNKPQNETQEVSVSATAGSFALRLYRVDPSCPRQDDTGPIAFNASAGVVQAALETLCGFSAGDIAVTGSDGGPWTIEFSGGYADTDILPLQVVNSTLSGGGASAQVGTIQGGANFEICTPSNGDVCRPGQGLEFGQGGGASAGQFTRPTGIALDSNGNVYVFDERSEGEENARVQKFDPQGDFLLMFGGEVDKTTHANLCTKVGQEAGDECGIGVPGTANAHFTPLPQGFEEVAGSYLAFSANTLFVGDRGRIQEFNLDGTFKSKIDFEEKELKELEGKTVRALASDSAGNLYLAVVAGQNVYELDPAGNLLKSFKLKRPHAVALDVEGNLYVIDNPPGFGTTELEPRVVEFDPSGKEVIPFAEEFAAPADGAILRGIATNVLGPTSPASTKPGNLYTTFENGPDSYLEVYGPPPIEFGPPPLHPPEIKAQYAVSVDTRGAELRAQINPRFWADTDYYVQYGTGECSKGGCQEQPLAPGARLTNQIVSTTLTTKSVLLSNLVPGTTYHYRFVAESTGGGPVFGVGGKPGLDGGESTFRTLPLPTEAESCRGNQQFRGGASAALPDCRAYEMVSPVEKNNGDIITAPNTISFPTSLVQSATSGSKFTYSAIRSFGDPEGAPYTSQYLAARDPGTGWSTEAISPPRTTLVLEFTGTTDNEYKAFSEDLCTAWLRHDSEPPLAGGAVLGFLDLYKRENCDAGRGTYETLTPVKPPDRIPDEYAELELQGVSADGSHAIYVAPDNLTKDAPNIGEGTPDQQSDNPQLYEYAGGQLRFLCYLPNGSKSTLACSAGSHDRVGANEGRRANLHNAVSADGARVYWTETTSGLGSGTLYLRENADQAQSKISGGKCSEPAKACTYLVSSEPALFWGAAANGSKAVFTTGEPKAGNGKLFEFDATHNEEPPTLIAEGVAGVMGMSENASRVYFVSTEVLDTGAKAGQPNLYLHEDGGSTSYVATLAADDVRLGTLASTPVEWRPVFRTSRVSADGSHVAFMSTASLTGYDNSDANSGEEDTEVYLYDANAKQLICASCNPSGARPSGRKLLSPNGHESGLWGAAKIPGWERSLYASRLLSDDGKRLFFESYEALVPSDTNGAGDVYEWEAAGKGSCSEDDATFSQNTGGCVDLISSGKSPRDSIFLDASPGGEDVFVATLSSLLPQDDGLVDVYDARINGGFSSPEPPRPPCEGEACQSPQGPPVDPTPSSSTFHGPGNRRGRACRKGARKVHSHGKTRCRKKRAKHKALHKQSRHPTGVS